MQNYNMKISNKESVGKYFIITDMKFSDFMKNEQNEINLYDTYDKAAMVAGIYELDDVLICKVEANRFEPED